jgi:hypothetical protein
MHNKLNIFVLASNKYSLEGLNSSVMYFSSILEYHQVLKSDYIFIFDWNNEIA